jgi:hypothetical protein
MARITYIAKWNGEVVGKRASEREYKFALVCQRDVGAHRERAYDPSPTKQDIDHFNWLAFIAACRPMEPAVYRDRGSPMRFEAGRIAAAAEITRGGIEAFVQRRVASDIQQFETLWSKGHFNPFVYRWSMTERAARGASNEARNPPFRDLLGIVPVEVKS